MWFDTMMYNSEGTRSNVAAGTEAAMPARWERTDRSAERKRDTAFVDKRR